MKEKFCVEQKQLSAENWAFVLDIYQRIENGNGIKEYFDLTLSDKSRLAQAYKEYFYLYSHGLRELIDDEKDWWLRKRNLKRLKDLDFCWMNYDNCYSQLLVWILSVKPKYLSNFCNAKNWILGTLICCDRQIDIAKIVTSFELDENIIKKMVPYAVHNYSIQHWCVANWWWLPFGTKFSIWGVRSEMKEENIAAFWKLISMWSENNFLWVLVLILMGLVVSGKYW